MSTATISRERVRPAFEVAVLRAVRAAGVLAPEPVHADESILVVRRIEGERMTRRESVRALAAGLAAIHRADWTGIDLAFVPRQDERVSIVLEARDDGLDELRQALVDARPADANPPTLVHGDFWPGNTLWRDDELVAVIDWEDATVGDPLVDLGNVRFEAAWLFDDDAVAELTDSYRAELPDLDYAALPYWDLFAVVRVLPALPYLDYDAARETAMRRAAEEFATRAVAALRG